MPPNKIHILDNQTINQIAAGEVIENPASVVKELVENALDAHATKILVEIQEGGRQLIRVSDDGDGMSREDALLCLERHATSKIHNIDDIPEIYTMGFRGEAIPSIASISHFSVLTAPREQEATLIRVEGGQVLSCTSAVRSPGTTIEVKSLFFNVPVRRKFQKSPTTDVQDILKMLHLLALGYPSIQFELLSDQKVLFKTLPSSSLLPFRQLLGQRIETLLGSETKKCLVAMNYQQAPFEIEGYISQPTAHKLNKTGQYLFINQRAVLSPFIGAAIREGYGMTLPSHRYPIFVLHLRLPGALLDVNVHPQKKEVRIRQEMDLREMLIQAVQTTLRQTPPFIPQEVMAPYVSILGKRPPPVVNEEPWIFQSLEVPSLEKVTPVPLARPPTLAPAFIPSIPRVLLTIVAYFLIEAVHLETRLFESAIQKEKGGLALIDQRASYARITYERLLKQTASTDVQPLLIPLTLQFSASESAILTENLALFHQLGFGIKEFGVQTFAIDTFPLALKQEHLQICLNEIIEELVETQTTRRLQTRKEERFAQIACRHSLSSSKRLGIEEAQALLQQLLNCQTPGICPFGKPTALYFAPEDLAKIFQKGNIYSF